jgi:hypothetical protein
MVAARMESDAELVTSKPANTKPPDIASASVPDALTALNVNPDTGLTEAEVGVRRKQHGYNEVAEKKSHPVLAFFEKFWGISAWILELIMVLSAVLGKYSDLVVVSALLVINAVLSFTQERRAAGVVEALRRRLQVNARVRRESNWQVIAARELVPGDIVRVRPGDVIPADVKLFTGAVTVDQSALTGESKDEDKASGAVLPSGSVVRRGEGNGVTWIVNKISRTILKVAFVAIAYVVTGKFVVSVFAMLLLTFMTDLAKIALFTDNVGSSRKPETWNIGGLITVSVILGVAMVAEASLLLWFDWSRFGLATDDNALYTFSFLLLLYFAVFSVLSARERHAFWSTMPSKALVAALMAEALTGTILTRVDLPGLRPLPWSQTLAIFAYAMVSCLIVNDTVKVAAIKCACPTPSHSHAGAAARSF